MKTIFKSLAILELKSTTSEIENSLNMGWRANASWQEKVAAHMNIEQLSNLNNSEGEKPGNKEQSPSNPWHHVE